MTTTIMDTRLKGQWRMAWAIAAKDIGDAVRNRTILVAMLGAVMMVLTSQVLPALLTLQGAARAVIYDEGDSPLVAALAADDDVVVGRATSQAGLEQRLVENAGSLLGLVIPAGDQPDRVEAYVAHWTGEQDIAEMRQVFSQKLSAAAGRPVDVVVASDRVYPAPDTSGRPASAALLLVVAVIIITTLVVPQLLIEEKEKHTLDVLLVSPATIGQVVIGKALAGLVYGLIVAAVVLAFNRALVVHWPLALVTVVTGLLCAVGVGLLLGTLIDNQQNLALWSVVMLVPLMGPMLVVGLGGAGTGWLATVSAYTPGVAMGTLFRHAFAGAPGWDAVVLNLGVLALWIVVLYAAVVWLVRRSLA